MALKDWNSICCPKNAGGLGFRLFWDFNLTLLSKLGWKLASDENGLSVEVKTKILKELVFLRGNFKEK